MSNRSQSVLADRELVEMLSYEPQLLAIADALVAVRSPAIEAWMRPERRHFPLPRWWKQLAPAAAAFAAIVVLLVAPPWGDGVDIVDRAYAAVGSQPVLHLAIVDPDAAVGSVVDLKTGAIVHRDLRTEIWFDERRDIKRTVLTVDGRVLDEHLETREGGLSRSGPIYTCQWIASHPAQAKEVGVSCDRSSRHGKEAVSVDPALAEFADGYRSALADGEAVVAGEDEINGRDVVWLELKSGSAVDRVAVDKSSYRPVIVESRDGHTRYEVVTAETLPFRTTLFAKPQPERVQIGSSVISSEEVAPAVAARALGGTLFWLGQEALGLELVSIEQEERNLRFNEGAARETATVIKLTYRPAEDDGAGQRLELYQSRTCLVSTGWTCGARDHVGSSLVGYPFGRSGPALIQGNGVYTSIWGSPVLQERSLEIARALVGTSGGA